MPTEAPTETPTATPTEPGGNAPITETPTVTPTGTPVTRAGAVRLNELLPNPRATNWDRRGRANAQDEWIELYNPGQRAIDLAGWTIAVQTPGAQLSQGYRFGRRSAIGPGAYLVLYQRDTQLVLDDRTATVRLLDADGRLVDSVTYEGLGPDESYSRDEAGVWHAGWPPTPGAQNAAPGFKRGGPLTPTPRIRRP